MAFENVVRLIQYRTKVFYKLLKPCLDLAVGLHHLVGKAFALLLVGKDNGNGVGYHFGNGFGAAQAVLIYLVLHHLFKLGLGFVKRHALLVHQLAFDSRFNDLRQCAKPLFILDLHLMDALMRDNVGIRLSRTVKRKVIGVRLGIIVCVRITPAERYAVAVSAYGIVYYKLLPSGLEHLVQRPYLLALRTGELPV